MRNDTYRQIDQVQFTGTPPVFTVWAFVVTVDLNGEYGVWPRTRRVHVRCSNRSWKQNNWRLKKITEKAVNDKKDETINASSASAYIASVDNVLEVSKATTVSMKRRH